jgi:hypothetical protein
MAPLGKNSSVFNTPKIALGTNGSLILTTSKNIMLMSASYVATMANSSRAKRTGSNG